MWFFDSPQVVFGEDALDYLEELTGRKAFIVTDQVLHELGFAERVVGYLHRAGIETEVFAKVEPEPSVQTAQSGAKLLQEYAPDWIVAVGGGSVLDAAKAMWALYEHPELVPEEITPVVQLSVGKCKLIAIPTTSGTGSEATWISVLTDTETHRKLGLGNRSLMPTIAVVDPSMTGKLPAHITADTGIDVLTHAIEGYTSNWRNDFTDGLCLKAAQLVFDWLPAAIVGGSDADEARERMSNAATIAGLGFGNSMVALAHAMGHSFGGYFRIPHGRAVGLFLPYTMQFTANLGISRYGDIARFLGFTSSRDEMACTEALVAKIVALKSEVDQPLTLAETGVAQTDFENAIETLCSHAEIDNGILASPRMPETEELQKLFEYAWAGKPVDF